MHTSRQKEENILLKVWDKNFKEQTQSKKPKYKIKITYYNEKIKEKITEYTCLNTEAINQVKNIQEKQNNSTIWNKGTIFIEKDNKIYIREKIITIDEIIKNKEKFKEELGEIFKNGFNAYKKRVEKIKTPRF